MIPTLPALSRKNANPKRGRWTAGATADFCRLTRSFRRCSMYCVMLSTNGIRFTELDRQRLNRVKYHEPEPVPEEVTAA